MFVDNISISCKLCETFLEEKICKQVSVHISLQQNGRRNNILVSNSALWSQATFVFAIKEQNVSTLLFIQISMQGSWSGLLGNVTYMSRMLVIIHF